jgi:phospholipase D1/2
MTPCRKGYDLTLYQDAHIFDGSLPEVMLEDGVKFHHHRYWEELCTSILEAHHMVYIAGLTRSQVTGWNPPEGFTKSSCGKLRLGSTLPASNSRKG